MRTQLIAILLTLTTGFPAIAADNKVELTREELLAHSEIQGALAAIDAWVQGRQMFDRIPGVSVGIVHDQDVLWSSG